MNTPSNLDDAFTELARSAPDHASVRTTIAGRIDRQAKRRRTGALIGVAAAVVLVAGGAVTVPQLFSGGGSNAAGPGGGQTGAPAVVSVPDVPLPDDTQLVRYQLQPVTSPVSATAPEGLTGTVWSRGGGQLLVGFFAPGTGLAVGNDAITSAGYEITAHQDDSLFAAGSSGTTTAKPTERQVTVAGHEATLSIAPEGAPESQGFPAERVITWELSSGKWIHVWANDAETGPPTGAASSSAGSATAAVPAALASFAESITEQPTTLPRTMGIGLSLPGLTPARATNSTPISGFLGQAVLFCPTGTDPFAEGYPDAGSNPQSQCLVVIIRRVQQGQDPASGTPVTVGDTTVHVVSGTADASGDTTGDVAGDVARRTLRDGLIAVVAAPASAHLSKQDLAALAASVRLSPDVTVLPPPDGDAGSASASASGSASSSDWGTAEPGTAEPGTVSSQVAAPGAGGTPPDQWIAIPSDHPTKATIDPDTRTGAVTIWLKNTGDELVTIKDLTLSTDRLSQTRVRLDVDALEALPDGPTVGPLMTTSDPVPMQLDAGAMVPFTIEFRVRGCDAAPAGPSPDIDVDYEFHHGGGSSSFPLTPDPGANPDAVTAWLTDLLAPVCG